MDYTDIKIAVTQAENIFDKAAEQAKTLILDSLADLVNKYPFVKSVSWTQGPSGFNDGEPEYFRISDPVAEYAIDYDGDIEEFRYDPNSPYEDEKSFSLQLSETFDMSEHDIFEKRLYEVGEAMYYSEEVMKRAFGEEGQKIIVYADKVDYQEWRNYY